MRVCVAGGGGYVCVCVYLCEYVCRVVCTLEVGERAGYNSYIDVICFLTLQEKAAKMVFDSSRLQSDVRRKLCLMLSKAETPNGRNVR